ncbi:MAG: hypothetical protein KGI69_01950 [Patescibacteria group bacterium]|nr:hypothetical protein [Patescibacteria group bacterium]
MKKNDLMIEGLKCSSNKCSVTWKKNPAAKNFEFIVVDSQNNEMGRGNTESCSVDLGDLKDHPGDYKLTVTASDDKNDGPPVQASFTVGKSGMTKFSVVPYTPPIPPSPAPAAQPSAPVATPVVTAPAAPQTPPAATAPSATPPPAATPPAPSTGPAATGTGAPTAPPPPAAAQPAAPTGAPPAAAPPHAPTTVQSQSPKGGWIRIAVIVAVIVLVFLTGCFAIWHAFSGRIVGKQPVSDPKAVQTQAVPKAPLVSTNWDMTMGSLTNHNSVKAMMIGSNMNMGDVTITGSTNVNVYGPMVINRYEIPEAPPGSLHDITNAIPAEKNQILLK